MGAQVPQSPSEASLEEICGAVCCDPKSPSAPELLFAFLQRSPKFLGRFPWFTGGELLSGGFDCLHGGFAPPREVLWDLLLPVNALRHFSVAPRGFPQHSLGLPRALGVLCEGGHFGVSFRNSVLGSPRGFTSLQGPLGSPEYPGITEASWDYRSPAGLEIAEGSGDFRSTLKLPRDLGDV